MKFGHASTEDLEQISFVLPPDSPASLTKTGDTNKNFKVHTGCGKWGIKEWVGTVYPEKTKQKDFLNVYLETFGAIELNGTFYRLSRSSIDKWSEAAANTGFKYCPKWSQRISHFKRLNEVEENVQYFIESMKMLGDNLGATFLTLPPNFGPKHTERVLSFIKLIPEGYPLHLEFRHADWYQEEHFDNLVKALSERQLGLVITDVALRRDVLHMCCTAPTVFVRFNGYGLHTSDYERLDQWIDRLGQWRNSKVEEVFFFMHQQDERHTPVLCSYFAEQVRQKLELDIVAPKIDL